MHEEEKRKQHANDQKIKKINKAINLAKKSLNQLK